MSDPSPVSSAPLPSPSSALAAYAAKKVDAKAVEQQAQVARSPRQDSATISPQAQALLAASQPPV